MLYCVNYDTNILAATTSNNLRSYVSAFVQYSKHIPTSMYTIILITGIAIPILLSI